VGTCDKPTQAAPQAAQDLIEGAKKQDPTNPDVITGILAAIYSLQTQIIYLAKKQASTTSTVSSATFNYL